MSATWAVARSSASCAAPRSDVEAEEPAVDLEEHRLRRGEVLGAPELAEAAEAPARRQDVVAVEVRDLDLDLDAAPLSPASARRAGPAASERDQPCAKQPAGVRARRRSRRSRPARRPPSGRRGRSRRETCDSTRKRWTSARPARPPRARRPASGSGAMSSRGVPARRQRPVPSPRRRAPLGAGQGVEHGDAVPVAAGHRPGLGRSSRRWRVPAAAGEPAGRGRRGSVGLEEQEDPAAVQQDRRPVAEHAPGGGRRGRSRSRRPGSCGHPVRGASGRGARWASTKAAWLAGASRAGQAVPAPGVGGGAHRLGERGGVARRDVEAGDAVVDHARPCRRCRSRSPAGRRRGPRR